MKEFSYIIGCEKTGDAAVIDPGGEVERIIEEAKKAGLSIKYIFNTHYHADHTCGNGKLKKKTGAKILIHRLDLKQLVQPVNLVKIGTFMFQQSPKPDIIIDKDEFISVGEIKTRIIHTPGHTRGGICFLAGSNLFTGDTLFVGDSGRTNLPEGDRAALGASIRMLMNTLPDDTIVWPGHDYGPTPHSTLAWEKRNNINAVEYGFYSD